MAERKLDLPFQTAPDGPSLLRLAAVQRRTGLSRSMLYRLLAAGAFPRPVKLGHRAVGWPDSEISGWIADRLAARSEG